MTETTIWGLLQFYDALNFPFNDGIENIWHFITDEYLGFYGPLTTPLQRNHWVFDKLFDDESIPRQLNGYDCGVFILAMADYYSQAFPPNFTQDDMEDFRYRIAMSILSNAPLTSAIDPPAVIVPQQIQFLLELINC